MKKTTVKDIIAEKFPELEKARMQIQGARRVPPERDPNKKTRRHIIVRMLDAVDRDTILQLARSKKEITHKGAPLRFTADLSEETLQAQRQWGDIVKKLNEMNTSPRILYPAKLSLKLEGAIHYFSDK